MSFAEYRIDDARILEVCARSGGVQVRLKNWRDEIETAVFEDVVGMEAFDWANTDLSHGAERTDDPLLEKSVAIEGEKQDGFRCFAFLSAWNDQPVLKIVARSFRVTRE